MISACILQARLLQQSQCQRHREGWATERREAPRGFRTRVDSTMNLAALCRLRMSADCEFFGFLSAPQSLWAERSTRVRSSDHAYEILHLCYGSGAWPHAQGMLSRGQVLGGPWRDAATLMLLSRQGVLFLTRTPERPGRGRLSILYTWARCVLCNATSSIECRARCTAYFHGRLLVRHLQSYRPVTALKTGKVRKMSKLQGHPQCQGRV